MNVVLADIVMKTQSAQTRREVISVPVNRDLQEMTHIVKVFIEY